MNISRVLSSGDDLNSLNSAAQAGAYTVAASAASRQAGRLSRSQKNERRRGAVNPLNLIWIIPASVSAGLLLAAILGATNEGGRR